VSDGDVNVTTYWTSYRWRTQIQLGAIWSCHPWHDASHLGSRPEPCLPSLQTVPPP
jgi:hypothetical protein